MKTRKLFCLVILIFSLGGSAVADPLRPGGALTHDDVSKKAFTRPGPTVLGKTKDQFYVGNSFFNLGWVEAPASAQGRDGLGPTYNAISCSACHLEDGRGRGYITKNGTEAVHLSLLFRLSQKTEKGIFSHPEYGEQLNPVAIPSVPAEGQVQVSFKIKSGQYADGSSYELREPQFTFSNFLFSKFDENTLISPRVAPQMIGLGLVDALSEAALQAHADENDANGDGISGRANFVYDIESGTTKIGKFGWKANQPSLAQQDAGAFLGDMGITTRLFPEENCPLVQVACAQAQSGGSPGGHEADDGVLNAVVIYSQTLGVPARRNAEAPEVIAGEQVFRTVGCAGCHVPSFTTDDSSPMEVLRNQTFYPYSDFLLHDMGPDLADHRPDHLATGSEWRTPPLWGVGLFQKVNKHQNLLHDARARNVEEAILWHGGEAEKARESFKKSSATDRKNLVSFVNSL